MSKLGCLFLAIVFASSTWSCTDYGGLLEIEHLPDEYDLSDGIYGRLWLNPNPIKFQPLMPGSPEVVMPTIFMNIGTEDLNITAVHTAGDPDFMIQPEIQHYLDTLEDLLPVSSHGKPGCFEYTKIGLPIIYQPTSGDQANGALVFETNDPTSPTLEVPLVLDPNAQPFDPDIESPYGTVPLVSPNPIRFDSANLQAEQTLEVCVNLFDWEPMVTITNIEAYGSSFSVGQLSDSTGNQVELPFSYMPETYDFNLVEIIFSPGNEVTEGALRVQFIDSNEEQRILYVPILFR